MPVEWVNVVHRTQTSHHPAPYDPEPCRRGTLNYYGSMIYGRISFAVLADRQFKSGPEGKVPATGPPRGDHVKDPAFDPRSVDMHGLTLLGDRQETFIREWVADWRGADMKAVISQSVFTAMATTHGGNREVLMADYDSNGWAQSPRDRALRELRKAFVVHLAGDQHLPAVVHYGIDTHRDGPVAFAGPTVKGCPRWWEPAATGRNRTTGNTELTGDFVDHFGSPLTVLAVCNGPLIPSTDILAAGEAKTGGLGIVRFHKRNRTVTFECWPYFADVTRPGTQMPTWPVTVRQIDTYVRPVFAHLPELQISGISDPVVLVYEEATGELVYGLRLRQPRFQPHVFAAGSCRVVVGEPGTERLKTLAGLTAAVGGAAVVEVVL